MPARNAIAASGSRSTASSTSRSSTRCTTHLRQACPSSSWCAECARSVQVSRDFPRTSGFEASLAASWSTRGSSASSTVARTMSGWGAPTSCTATSTAGWRRWSRCATSTFGARCSRFWSLRRTRALPHGTCRRTGRGGGATPITTATRCSTTRTSSYAGTRPAAAGRRWRVREIEAKFRVHSPFQVPELTGEGTGVSTVDEPVARELRAVYWDTSDLRLARECITLRHRSGEGDGDGWHLKLPVQEAGVPDASTGVRKELHKTGDNDTDPAALQELVTVQVRGAVLGPVATLCTARSTYLLRGSVNEVRAELTDDVVAVLNQGHVAGRFREIEVESVDGDADL